MTKYVVNMLYPDGTSELDYEEFDNEESARAHGHYLCSCYSQGAEDLYLSNPGDYPLTGDEADFEIVEVC